MTHIPVLENQVLNYLRPQPGERYIDATFGEGGHSKLLLKNVPDVKVLGTERDPQLFQKGERVFQEEIEKGSLILKNNSYLKIKEEAEEENFKPVNGIIFDLGMSSWHLEKSKRGFSLRKKEPLDMRYNEKEELTAKEILNNWNKSDIKSILKDYGDEQYAKEITNEIVKARKEKPIKNTKDLVKIIRKSVPTSYTKKRLHFATRTFQALRIAVNDEIKSVGQVLPIAEETLVTGGRLVIISFHSGEDRIIKNFLREGEKEGRFKITTKKPITPSEEEKKENPRSRSAKLRAAIKL